MTYIDYYNEYCANSGCLGQGMTEEKVDRIIICKNIIVKESAPDVISGAINIILDFGGWITKSFLSIFKLGKVQDINDGVDKAGKVMEAKNNF